MQGIWAGYVGPGISARGTNDSVWTDQTDMRPTILALTGLQDDYAVDGRVLVEITSPPALPRSLRDNALLVGALGASYKQILGSTGQFAQDTLAMSTRGLRSGSAGNDRTYQAAEATLTWLDNWRDRLADQMSFQLLGAAFHGTPINRRQTALQIAQAKVLLAVARRSAS